jgi:CBS domain-containing protein
MVAFRTPPFWPFRVLGGREPEYDSKEIREDTMAKSINDVMSANPCAIDAEKPVAYAAKMMQQEDVGLAPIVEGDRLVGTLTDRDIVTRVVAEGKDPQSVTVREVASTDLVTIDPQQDLDEALHLMASNQIRRLPVVEEDGRLVGVVAQADVAREAKDKKTGQMVEDISTG